MAKIYYHQVHFLLISLLVGFALAGCTPQPHGEKLIPAPGMQIIGETEGGGGSARRIEELMQSMAPEQEGGEKPAPPRKPLPVAPVAGDFGEVGPAFKWKPEDTLSEKEVLSHLEKARRWQFGAYRLYLWNEDFQQDTGQGVALYHHDTLAYARKGWFYLTDPRAKEEDGDDNFTLKGPAPGADLDGDGLPDLLLYGYSGGAHCCWTVQHIECGPRPLLRCELYTRDSQPLFEDLDGDGRFEVKFADTSYAYWHECFANSPFPPVVLRMRQGHYEMAGDLMRAQGPAAAELAQKTGEIRDWIAHYQEIAERLQRGGKPPRNDRVWEDRPQEMWRHSQVSIPSPVWGVMLDLIYSGRCREALAFVDAVWPTGKPGKEHFIRDVTAKVLESWFGVRLPWINDLVEAVY